MERRSRMSGAVAWLDERIGFDEIRQMIAHKSVPRHSATMWYYFGGITLFLFVILFAGLATFFALVALLRRGRPPGAAIDVPRATDDRFALLVAGRDARFDARGLAEELVARGAVATQERFVDDPEDAEDDEMREDRS